MMCVCVNVRGQLAETGSLRPCVSWGWNLGHQIQQHAPLYLLSHLILPLNRLYLPADMQAADWTVTRVQPAA